MGFNSGFKGLIPYRQWKHTEAAPLICYAQQTVVFLHTFRKLILFILTVCCIDMVSEWLEYCIHLRSISQGIPHQTYASTAPTSRHQMILIQFELFYLFIIYFLHKYWCTPHEDDPQRADTCHSYSALSVKTLKYNIVHLLTLSPILILFISIYVFLLTLLTPSLRFSKLFNTEA